MTVLAFAPWQSLLNGLGWCLAEVYSVVPNYGGGDHHPDRPYPAAPAAVRVQKIKSMQHMQALQPELKQLQKKYKNNKQKLQEEQMQLYREAGVNPLGGCLPLLLTLPFLFAMYAVIRPPLLSANLGATGQVASYQIVNNHLPENSEAVLQTCSTHQNLEMAGINLQCSLATSGTQAELRDTQKQPYPRPACRSWARTRSPSRTRRPSLPLELRHEESSPTSCTPTFCSWPLMLGERHLHATPDDQG